MTGQTEALDIIDPNDLPDDGEAPNLARGDVLEDEPKLPEKPATGAAPEAQPPAPNKDATAAEEEGPRDEKGRFIPKPRFDEVNNQRKALAHENQQLQEQLRQLQHMQSQQLPVIADEAGNTLTIADAERRAMELVLEGDHEAALALRMQINNALASIALQQMIANQGHLTLTHLAENALDAYPELLDDQALLDHVVVLRDGYEMRGLPKAVALQNALQAVFGNRQPQAEPSVPQQSALPQAPAPNPGEVRRQQAVARGLDTANRQPPANFQAGVSNRGDTGVLDVSKISEEGFKKLSEDERARLRGDLV